MTKPPSPPGGLTAVTPGEWTKLWVRVRTTGQVKNVGWACAFFADYGDGANVRPGTAILANVCSGASEATIKKALAQIREWGLMWRYIEGSKQGRRGVADVYRLTIPDDLFKRVPLLTPEYRPPVDNPTDQVLSEHVLSEHVLSGSGTGIARASEQVFSQHPTYPEHLTNHLATSPVVNGSVSTPVAAELSTSGPKTAIERAAWQAAQSRKERMNGSAQ